ncbi:hypothetical protein, partial [Vibrio tasmaniensis]|uniref:hypothetical protein n=1 Tax=Vibrio tasmaniensis TaxID=212663 RepID=UPI00198096DB
MKLARAIRGVLFTPKVPPSGSKMISIKIMNTVLLSLRVFKYLFLYDFYKSVICVYLVYFC